MNFASIRRVNAHLRELTTATMGSLSMKAWKSKAERHYFRQKSFFFFYGRRDKEKKVGRGCGRGPMDKEEGQGKVASLE
jgi:hypothetical protein